MREESAVLGTSDNVDDEPAEVLPTCGETLQAMLLLRRYTKGLNDPLARSVEMTLGSFARRTRTEDMQNMKDTKIMLYYHHKQ